MSSTKRSPKDTVGIEQKAGKIRLRLPRSVASGSQRYISTRLEATPDNLKKAQVRAWEIEEDLRLGKFDSTLVKYQFKPQLTLVQPKQTEPDLGHLWQKYLEYKKPQLALTTYQRDYQTRFSNWVAKLPTRDLTKAALIRDYLLQNTSPASAKRLLWLFSACCQWAVKSGMIQKNPFAGMATEIKAQKYNPEAINPFRLEEREAIFIAFQEHPRYNNYYPFVRFLFLTGCRTGEAIALRWKDINKDCSRITFAESYSTRLHLRKTTKTGKSRIFPCNPVLQALLCSIRPDQPDPEALVFTTLRGKYINTDDFRKKIWKPIINSLVEAGKVQCYRSTYDTRHTFISMALEAGLTVNQVAKLAGNTPQVILQHYAGNLLKFEVPVV